MTDRERLNLIRIIQNAEPENGMYGVSVEAMNEILDLLKESVGTVPAIRCRECIHYAESRTSDLGGKCGNSESDHYCYGCQETFGCICGQRRLE